MDKLTDPAFIAAVAGLITAIGSFFAGKRHERTKPERDRKREERAARKRAAGRDQNPGRKTQPAPPPDMTRIPPNPYEDAE